MADKAVDSLQLVARELGPFGGDEGKNARSACRGHSRHPSIRSGRRSPSSTASPVVHAGVGGGSDRRAEYGPGAVGVGWDMGLLGLARHVELGIATPLETPEWSASDEAKAFIAGSSELLADAAIASGDDPDATRAAAARTTAAYTG
ncbi:hypothetical protein QM716_25010 [Rhodococcus sp. IEGM 1409]|uniref:hypothetical protein n=1 Tax=Rhodococcus sp. IEGM 1409 TaxID=3047082 RepID=UPI0024B73831|nr:hypothetical protein [Rhodococcus sp. IEGM 1409]MDI9903119.1 hypothetical protein [Rhodococcus sp. IEGM 1409]